MTTNHLMLTFLQFWTCDSHDEDVELTEQDPRHTDLTYRPAHLIWQPSVRKILYFPIGCERLLSHSSHMPTDGSGNHLSLGKNWVFSE